MLKAALIGLGDISAIHLPAIKANPNVELTAVCDLDKGARDIVPEARFYTDYQEMLESEALNVVHICLPHYLHNPVTKACVEKGIHVFLEKPLGLNTKEALELVELEQKHPDIKICVCFQNRYNESFEMLQEIVESGEYGRIVGIKGLVAWYRPKSYYDAKPWRGQMKYAGGGVMINQALHTIDLMQLLGGKIESIRGNVDQLLDYGIEVEDTASARMQFESGATGLFFATNANAVNSSVELQVILENGKFTIKDSILTRVNEDGKKEELVEDAKVPGTKFYYGASHKKLIHLFHQCIEEDTDNYVHAREAAVAIQMIDVIRKSSETRQSIQMEG
ncbi:Gfo/Idh/MocA family protein [Neobacillus sp. 19]|uniref:Gfo/Idh/MocA family protein n=2 Tax=Bacillaceae TaxID=186817 RepID=UPI003BF6A11A